MTPTRSTRPQHASTSHTQLPESSSIGMAYSRFHELMSKLTSHRPELSENTPNGDICLEAQTVQQSKPNASSKVSRDSPSGTSSASGLDTNIPEVPPPSYTLDNRVPSVWIQTPPHSFVAN